MINDETKKALKRLSDSYYRTGNSKIITYLKAKLGQNLNNLKNEKFETNDEIFEKLEEVSQYIYPISSEALGFIKKTLETLENYPLPTNERKTKFGTIRGKSHKDVVKKCIELLDQIRYLQTEGVIELLAKLFLNDDTEIKQKSLDAIKRLCKYDLYALNNLGYEPQKKFLATIKEWSERKKIRYLEFILTGLPEILNPDFEGMEWTDFQTATHHSGSLKKDKWTTAIREAAIEILQNLYEIVPETKDKLAVIRKLDVAMHVPFNGGNIRDLIKDNVKTILQFYTKKIVANAELEVLSALEGQVMWAERRFEDDGIKEIKSLWKILESNTEYQIYRVLVGYDRKYKKDLGWKEADEFRSNEVEKYIKDISPKTQERWIKRILLIAGTYKNVQDFGQFQHFNEFLRRIGKEQPTSGLLLLEINAPELVPFIGFIICGLWESSKVDDANKILKTWLGKDLNLDAIAHALRMSKKPDLSMMKTILAKVSKKRDNKLKRDLLYNLLLTLGFEHTKNKALFLEIMQELTKAKINDWTNWFYGASEERKTIFHDLNEDDWNIILESLLGVGDIGYNVEYVLEILAETYPKKLVQFFHERTQIEEKTNYSSRYSAIPHRPFRLGTIADKKQKEIVDEVWKWFDEKQGWKAGILLQSLYPGFCERMEEKMRTVIEKGNKKEWDKYILPIFQWYQGDILESFVLETVKKLPKSEELWGTCSGYLANPGMVSGKVGEPSMANAYRAKKERIKKWDLSDPKVKAFAEQHAKYLDADIKREEKRHLEEMEKFKRRLE